MPPSVFELAVAIACILLSDFLIACLRLHNAQLGCRDVQRIHICCQSCIRLLGAIRSDQGIDLDAVDIIQLLQRILDLSLVGLHVHDEYQCVVLLNLLHGTLGVERVDDYLVVVESLLMRDRLARVLGRPRQL